MTCERIKSQCVLELWGLHWYLIPIIFPCHFTPPMLRRLFPRLWTRLKRAAEYSAMLVKWINFDPNGKRLWIKFQFSLTIWRSACYLYIRSSIYEHTQCNRPLLPCLLFNFVDTIPGAWFFYFHIRLNSSKNADTFEQIKRQCEELEKVSLALERFAFFVSLQIASFNKNDSFTLNRLVLFMYIVLYGYF